MKRQLVVTGVTPIPYEDITCVCISAKRLDTDKAMPNEIGFGPRLSTIKGVTFSDFEFKDFLAKSRSDVLNSLYRFINKRTGKVEKLSLGSLFYVNFERLAQSLIKAAEQSGKLSPEGKNIGVFKISIAESYLRGVKQVVVQLFYNNGEGYFLLLEQGYSVEMLSAAYNTNKDLIPSRLFYLIKDFNKLEIQPELITYGFVYSSSVLKVVYM